MAFVKNEPAGNSVKTLLVNAINDFDAAGIELRQHWGHRLYVFELRQLCSDRHGHGRAAEGHQVGSLRRLNHDVRADAFDAFGRFREQAAGKAHDDNDERNLNGYGQHGDERAQRPVQDVLHDHVTNHKFLARSGNCERANVAAPWCFARSLCEYLPQDFRRD